MNIQDPHKRLSMFWGRVDLKHVSEIGRFATGKAVLDMGAGYGTTANYLTEKGFEVTAIDLDDESIAVAKSINPNINYLKVNAEDLPFEDASFDTLVLRDALHHFVGEADFDKVKKEMLRVLKPGGVVIFFDPNVNFMLKTMRKLAKHDDEECSYEEALQILDDLGLKLVHKSFNTLFSLPLSGGYVGVNLVPNVKFIQSMILGLERGMESLFQNGLGRQLAWRYMIVGKKE